MSLNDAVVVGVSVAVTHKCNGKHSHAEKERDCVCERESWHLTSPQQQKISMVATVATKSLWSRPLDLIYFVYFATHIPITLLVDLQSVYPPEYVPQLLKDVNQWYLTTYKDPLMTNASSLPWFKSFAFCEFLFQTPLFFAACYGLYKSMAPLNSQNLGWL